MKVAFLCILVCKRFIRDLNQILCASWGALRRSVTQVGARSMERGRAWCAWCNDCVENLPLSKSMRGKGILTEVEVSWPIMK